MSERPLQEQALPSIAAPAVTTHVYQREVQETGQDSLFKILRKIPPGARVLDVGTGSGGLGRQLAKLGDCAVDGITYNEDEAALARAHYRQLVVMDLEREPLPEALGVEPYDVVVCADVLEHLRNAPQVLRALGRLLKPEGVVLVSIPNVTHLGVILGLLAGRFVRTREGLLDATHVHFMDRTALHALVRDAGFEVTSEDAVRRNLVDTEFARLDGQAVPKTVRAYVLSLPDADVYQFIWTLKRRDSESGAAGVVETSYAPPAIPVIKQVPRFRTQLFLDRGQGFSEQDCVEAFGTQTEGLQTLIYPIHDGADVQALRLDFSDRPGQMEFAHLTARDAQDKPVWTWNGDWASNQIHHQSDWTGVRGWWGGRMVRATGEDPWVQMPLQAGQWANVQRVELCVSSPQPLGSADWPGLNVPALQRMLENLTTLFQERIATLETYRASAQSLADFRQTDIDTLRRELAAAQGLADFRQTDIDALRRELSALSALRQTDIDTLRSELAAARQEAGLLLNQLQVMRASPSWRYTAGLRWLARLFRRGTQS